MLAGIRSIGVGIIIIIKIKMIIIIIEVVVGSRSGGGVVSHGTVIDASKYIVRIRVLRVAVPAWIPTRFTDIGFQGSGAIEGLAGRVWTLKDPKRGLRGGTRTKILQGISRGLPASKPFREFYRHREEEKGGSCAVIVRRRRLSGTTV